MTTRILFYLLILLPAAGFSQLIGDTENGLASYYSAEFDGAPTAYDVVYNKNQLVAAHRQFPFNSTVRVKNISNGKTVTVRIIDEGPFIRSRIIELSERAAAVIDLLGKETVPVELTLLSVPGQQGRAIVVEETPIVNDPVVVPAEPAPARVREEPRSTTPASPTTTAPASAPSVSRASEPTAAATRPQPTVSARATVKATPVSDKKTITRQETFAPGVYKIQLNDVPAGKHGVQVGSFNNLESAMDKVTEMQSKWFDNVLIERVNTGVYSSYKVILGPFDTQKSALRYASDLKSRYKIDGFTVELQ